MNALQITPRMLVVDATGRISVEFYRALNALRSAALLDSSSLATSADIASAIAALSLGTAAQANVSDFATPAGARAAARRAAIVLG